MKRQAVSRIFKTFRQNTLKLSSCLCIWQRAAPPSGHYEFDLAVEASFYLEAFVKNATGCSLTSETHFQICPPRRRRLPACEPGLSVETQMVTSDFVQNENKNETSKQTKKKNRLCSHEWPPSCAVCGVPLCVKMCVCPQLIFVWFKEKYLPPVAAAATTPHSRAAA